MASLAVLVSDPPHTLSQGQGIAVVATVDLSHVLDVPHHGLMVLKLLVKSLSHVRESLIQLGHPHTPHHQPADPPHRLGIWGEGETRVVKYWTCDGNTSV